MPTIKRPPSVENFKSQEEADADLARNGSAHDDTRGARAPLDFVPGEHPKQRAARLKVLGVEDTISA